MLGSFLKSDAFREEIFEYMSEGIIIVDERGFIVVANPCLSKFSVMKKATLSVTRWTDFCHNVIGAVYQFRETFSQHPCLRMDRKASFYRFTFNLISDEKNITN